MNATWRWLCALVNERYEANYWESVALNEWWLRMLLEITKDD